jgi:lauroyl/myristoyl acyltransferase
VERLLLTLTPRRARYRVMVWTARLLAVRRPRTPLDTAADQALATTLARVHSYGLRYDLRLRVENHELLAGAVEAGRGVLLVSAHALLGFTITNYLDDAGYEPVRIGTNAVVPKFGTGRMLTVVPRGQSHSSATRAALREGRLVATMADRSDLPPDRSVEFETAHGRVRATPRLLDLAVEEGAAVVFWLGRTDRAGTIRLIFGAPSGGAVMDDYVAFIQAQTAAPPQPARRSLGP